MKLLYFEKQLLKYAHIPLLNIMVIHSPNNKLINPHSTSTAIC